jgi:hypothetical protein
MRQIRWKRGVDHRKESHCERFEIRPIFCDVGPHVPAEYELYFLRVRVGLYPTQKDCKVAANDYRHIKPGETPAESSN